jgi:rhomboid protease GluP
MPLPPTWRWKLDRLRERLAAFFASDKPEEARPKLCPSCGTLVGATATRCHECGTSMSFSMAAVSKSVREAIPEETPVTYGLLGLNFMLFTITLLATAQAAQASGEHFSLFSGIDGRVLLRLGARSSDLILAGEWWRLVMPIFLHGGLIHLGMNMIVLKDLGPSLENVYGSARYLFLYMITGILGFVWTTVWDIFTLSRAVPLGSPMFRMYLSQYFGISVGASGALMGLLGLAIAITTRRGGTYGRVIRGQLLRSLGFVLLMGLMIPGIDNAAHLGGVASGFLLGRIVEDREPLNPAERTRANAMGWIGGLLVVGSFAAMITRFLAAN